MIQKGYDKRTCTPEIAFTTVDLPWATCPIVPMLMVACLLMISGDRGVNLAGSSVARSCLAKWEVSVGPSPSILKAVTDSSAFVQKQNKKTWFGNERGGQSYHSQGIAHKERGMRFFLVWAKKTTRAKAKKAGKDSKH